MMPMIFQRLIQRLDDGNEPEVVQMMRYTRKDDKNESSNTYSMSSQIRCWNLDLWAKKESDSAFSLVGGVPSWSTSLAEEQTVVPVRNRSSHTRW